MEGEKRRTIVKRHSFPVARTYTETLNILKKNQETHNGHSKHGNIPVIESSGTEADRESQLQHAISWLRRELQDMRYQDKFLARQFVHLSSTIQHMRTELSAMNDDTDCDSLPEDGLEEEYYPQHYDRISDLPSKDVYTSYFTIRPSMEKRLSWN